MTASINMGRVIEAHNAIRDARTARRHAWEAADALLEEDQNKLRAVLLGVLNASNANSMATDYGTVYRTERIKPSAADWSAIYAWIMQDPERFELLEKRLKVTTIKEYMEATGTLPPGVNIHREYDIGVRRPTAPSGSSV
jgi:hypothetical protein